MNFSIVRKFFLLVSDTEMYMVNEFICNQIKIFVFPILLLLMSGLLGVGVVWGSKGSRI